MKGTTGFVLGLMICIGVAHAAQCPDTPTECFPASSLDACQALVDAGCQQVASGRNCPATFLCLDEAASSSCPDISDACVNEDNLAFCQSLEAGGCTNIAVLESCPLQFQCGDEPLPIDSACPNIKDPCMDEKSVAECEALVDTGCEAIFMAKSCPPKFSCREDVKETYGTEAIDMASRPNSSAFSSGKWWTLFGTALSAFFR